MRSAEEWEQAYMEDCGFEISSGSLRDLIRRVRREQYEHDAGIANAEPELPGPQPKEIELYECEDLCRAAVRATKKNIAKAILEQKGATT